MGYFQVSYDSRVVNYDRRGLDLPLGKLSSTNFRVAMLL